MLMGDLFDWLKRSKDHLLIRSCVFHFEFEFIHPFIDGNGRMGRLWQSLILGKLHPLFEHLPVENMVYSNQQQYYDAITASTNAGQSGPFIDFMLGEIYKTLKEHQGSPLPNTEDEFDAKFGKEFGVKFGVKFGVNERKVLLLLASNPSLSAENIAEQIGLTKRGVEKQLKKFRDLGIITRKGSDKTGYWEIVKEENV
jgi:Fic family protein